MIMFVVYFFYLSLSFYLLFSLVIRIQFFSLLLLLWVFECAQPKVIVEERKKNGAKKIEKKILSWNWNGKSKRIHFKEV